MISLHIYSRPIDSRVAFDLAQRRCYRRELSYYSKYGDVVVREVTSPPADAVSVVRPAPAALKPLPRGTIRPWIPSTAFASST